MEVTPVVRAAVSDVVFGQLVDEILSGRLAPGEVLPAERELAKSFQVNRHAIREALKRIQQAGLIRITHGGKTAVQDWRTHAGLDVLSALAASGAIPPLRVVRDIAEMRRSVAADAARLCAVNATDEQRAAVTQAAADYPSPGGAEVFAGDLAFWTAVVTGSGNVAYRLGLNTLVAAFGEVGWQVVADLGLAAEFAAAAQHRKLAAVIAARDATAAQRTAHRLLSRFVDAVNPRE
ncbi:FadR/GntR family transcriptional regulator [Kribbella sp. NPDC059898]|uniref:FadR/GntR family transcriptional regulator n=1 Tax=Kribbella sp. NPDC059898 TaxID=3346995 RepID=UPI003667C8B0